VKYVKFDTNFLTMYEKEISHVKSFIRTLHFIYLLLYRYI